VGQFLDGLREALDLIVSGDPLVRDIALRTLRVGFEATLIAVLLGVPAGTLLALRPFRGRGVAVVLVNAGIRLPPIALGHILWLAMWPDSRWGGGPLAGLEWIYTIEAVILAQTLLPLPIVIALTVAAVRRVPPAMLDQAEAFGAPAWRRGVLAVREARRGVTAAIIAALGTAIASVGAVVVIGNSLGSATLATATLTSWNAGGSDAHAVAYGTVLLAMFLVLAAALTVVQEGRAGWIPGRRS